PCCFRALWTVSATGSSGHEATSAFTAHCNLVRCAHSFRVCCRRAPSSCFHATTPPQLRGLSLLAPVGLSPTGKCALFWTRPCRHARSTVLGTAFAPASCQVP